MTARGNFLSQPWTPDEGIDSFMKPPFVFGRYDCFPGPMHAAAEIQIVGVRQGGETNAEFFRIWTPQGVDACQTGEEDMLGSDVRGNNLRLERHN